MLLSYSLMLLFIRLEFQGNKWHKFLLAVFFVGGEKLETIFNVSELENEKSRNVKK
jgi:hypothetical protein